MQFKRNRPTRKEAGSRGRPVRGLGLDRLDAEIMGPNPAYSVEVCP
jgi:hypothetical protein